MASAVGRIRLEHQNDLFGITVGKLTNQQRVDDAENPRRRADTDREHRDGEKREAWTARQQARTMLDVVNEIGVERELPAQPGRVVKRTDYASKHVELLFVR